MPGLGVQVPLLMVPILLVTTLLVLFDPKVTTELAPRIVVGTLLLLSLPFPVRLILLHRRIRSLQSGARSRLESTLKHRTKRDSASVARLVALSCGWPRRSILDVEEVKRIEETLHIQLPRLWVFRNRREVLSNQGHDRSGAVIGSSLKPKFDHAKIMPRIGAVLIVIMTVLSMNAKARGSPLPSWLMILGLMPGLICVASGMLQFGFPKRMRVRQNLITYEVLSGDARVLSATELNPENTFVWVIPESGGDRWLFMCASPPFVASSMSPELSDIPWQVAPEVAVRIGLASS